jgi:hypothetical protein
MIMIWTDFIFSLARFGTFKAWIKKEDAECWKRLYRCVDNNRQTLEYSPQCVVKCWTNGAVPLFAWFFPSFLSHTSNPTTGTVGTVGTNSSWSRHQVPGEGSIFVRDERSSHRGKLRSVSSNGGSFYEAISLLGFVTSNGRTINK